MSTGITRELCRATTEREQADQIKKLKGFVQQLEHRLIELESIDPNVVNERDDLRRRVTSQNFLLSSYEDRLVRYTDALGIPFTPEDRP